MCEEASESRLYALPVPAVRRNQFLIQAELAQRWRVSERTHEKWRSSGRGPGFVRVGRRILYDLGVIEAYEAASQCGIDR